LAKDYAEASFGFRNAELYAKDAYERLKRIAGKESEITTLVGLTLVEIYQKYNEKKNAERILSEVSEIFNETNIENSILLERYHNLQEKVAQMEDALNADEPMMETPVEEKVVLNSIVEPITPFEQDEPALDETLIMPSLNTVPQKLPEIEDLPVEPVVENHPEETLVPVVDDLPFEQEEEPKVEPIIEDLTDEMEAVKEPEISSVIEESKVEPIIEDLTDEIEVVKEPEIKPVVEELFTDIPKIPETPVPPIIENSFTEIPGLDGPIIKDESIEEVIHPDSLTQSQAVSQEEDTDQFFYDPKFEEAKKYFVSGNYMEAEKAFEDLSKSYETIYGKEDIRTLDATYLYGLTLSHVGKLLESKTAFEKVFESRRRVLGDTHDDTIHAERELSKICQRTGFNTMASMLAQDIFDKLNKK
ncbi:MAG: hypothetical protein IKE51_01225, partial [Solobacterium sp.]|nr:hypothetical protein [Solobacterium sp.]